MKSFFIKESLNYFGERRTDRREGSMFQGVETPSQVIQSAIFVNLMKISSFSSLFVCFCHLWKERQKQRWANLNKVAFFVSLTVWKFYCPTTICMHFEKSKLPDSFMVQQPNSSIVRQLCTLKILSCPKAQQFNTSIVQFYKSIVLHNFLFLSAIL